MQVLAEPRIDRLFEAMAEVTEQAIFDALTSAETTAGRAGHVRQSLRSAGQRS
jgi:D-aminopeptidase